MSLVLTVHWLEAILWCRLHWWNSERSCFHGLRICIEADVCELDTSTIGWIPEAGHRQQWEAWRPDCIARAQDRESTLLERTSGRRPSRRWAAVSVGEEPWQERRGRGQKEGHRHYWSIFPLPVAITWAVILCLTTGHPSVPRPRKPFAHSSGAWPRQDKSESVLLLRCVQLWPVWQSTLPTSWVVEDFRGSKQKGGRGTVRTALAEGWPSPSRFSPADRSAPCWLGVTPRRWFMWCHGFLCWGDIKSFRKCLCARLRVDVLHLLSCDNSPNSCAA